MNDTAGALEAAYVGGNRYDDDVNTHTEDINWDKYETYFFPHLSLMPHLA